MPSDRTDFLVEYYRLLVDDIRRSEAVIPKICALEGGAMVILIASSWGHRLSYLAPILVLLTSAWGVHSLMNSNLWACRSQLMAANVELEFFSTEDMDVLLPRSYYRDARRYRYRRVFVGPVLLSFGYFIIALCMVPVVPDPKLIGILVLSMSILVWLYRENRNCAREYAHLVAHAPGSQSVI